MKSLNFITLALLSVGVALGGVSFSAEQSQPAALEQTTIEENQASEELVGKIEAISEKEKLLKVQSSEKAVIPKDEATEPKPMEFVVNDKTSIMEGNKTLSLEDLKVGQLVKVTYAKPWLGFLGRNVALTIQCH